MTNPDSTFTALSSISSSARKASGMMTRLFAESSRVRSSRLSEAFSKHNKSQPGVAEEFADVMIFILGMCEQMGFDLEKELVRKIEINKKRKYTKTKSPEGKDVFIRIKTKEDP